MASGDVSPSKLPSLTWTKIIEENIATVSNTVEEKTNSSISDHPNSHPELANTMERNAASLNKDKIITAVNDILQRAQACIEFKGGAFEYKLKILQEKTRSLIFSSNVQHWAIQIIK